MSKPESATTEDEIYSEPADYDAVECEARGRADRLAGVNPVDCPYVAGYPVYAWERGYFGEDQARG